MLTATPDWTVGRVNRGGCCRQSAQQAAQQAAAVRRTAADVTAQPFCCSSCIISARPPILSGPDIWNTVDCWRDSASSYCMHRWSQRVKVSMGSHSSRLLASDCSGWHAAVLLSGTLCQPEPLCKHGIQQHSTQQGPSAVFTAEVYQDATTASSKADQDEAAKAA